MANEESNYSSLELEAIKRRERLRELKRKVNAGNKSENSSSDEELPKPSFRSYTPQDESIATAKSTDIITNDIEKEVQSQLELMKAPIVIDEIDIQNLAPRKPDWDLKRDVSKKLEKLERRTQKAIAELIRDRLKSDQDNILQVVNVGSKVRASNNE